MMLFVDWFLSHLSAYRLSFLPVGLALLKIFQFKQINDDHTRLLSASVLFFSVSFFFVLPRLSSCFFLLIFFLSPSFLCSLSLCVSRFHFDQQCFQPCSSSSARSLFLLPALHCYSLLSPPGPLVSAPGVAGEWRTRSGYLCNMTTSTRSREG